MNALHIALISRGRVGTMDRRLAKKEAFPWLMAKTFVKQPRISLQRKMALKATIVPYKRRSPSASAVPPFDYD